MTYNQERYSGDDGYSGQQVYDIKWRAREEPGVGAEKLEAEAHGWIENQVDEQEVSIAQAFLEAARNPENEHKTKQICD